MKSLEKYIKLKEANFPHTTNKISINGELYPLPLESELLEICAPDAIESSRNISVFRHAYRFKDGEWYVGSGISDCSALINLWFAMNYPAGRSDYFDGIGQRALKNYLEDK